jgi:hypothetical protein
VSDAAGFSIFAKSGFQIRFENGWIVSVQFGAIHYCENRNVSDPSAFEKMFAPELMEYGDELLCANAEVAAFKGDEWHTFEDDQNVKGWTTPAELLALLNEIASKP